MCVGHLKRWYYYHPLRLAFSEEEEAARKEFGKNAEIYRCERCHMLYRPVAADNSTAGQKFQVHAVNLWGDFFRKNPKSAAPHGLKRGGQGIPQPSSRKGHSTWAAVRLSSSLSSDAL